MTEEAKKRESFSDAVERCKAGIFEEIEERSPEWLAGQKRIHDRERADREISGTARK